MKNKFICLVLMTFVSYFLISCVTPKNIIKNGALCGIVVDENNNPVPNFLIFCFENENNKQSTITNESGIFVFPDVNLGTYFIEGEKQNYTKLVKKEYEFNDCSSLFCVQVMSFNECIKNINSFIQAKEFQKAYDFMENVKIESNTYLETLVLCYSAYLNYQLGLIDKYNICLDLLKKKKNANCNLFISLMEGVVNG